MTNTPTPTVTNTPTATNTPDYSKTPPTATPWIHRLTVTPEIPEWPRTGITSRDNKKPASVDYRPLHMELMIPSLNVASEIVSLEKQNGQWSVELLGEKVGLLEGIQFLGKNIAVIAGHNTLSADEYGPFALLVTMEEGDRFYIRDNENNLRLFEVFSNEKIDAHDMTALDKTAFGYESTIALLTCEDELPEGGYLNRRVVIGKEIW